MPAATVEIVFSAFSPSDVSECYSRTDYEEQIYCAEPHEYLGNKTTTSTLLALLQTLLCWKTSLIRLTKMLVSIHVWGTRQNYKCTHASGYKGTSKSVPKIATALEVVQTTLDSLWYESSTFTFLASVRVFREEQLRTMQDIHQHRELSLDQRSQTVL